MSTARSRTRTKSRGAEATIPEENGVSRDLKIAIIGAGIAGSAVGIALQNRGFRNVTIYERDDGFEGRRAGYGLTMLQGIGALRKLGHGILEKVQSLDTPSRSHYVFDSEGTIICFFGTCFYPEAASSSQKVSKKYNLHISRQNLRNILLETYCANSPQKGAVKWGHPLVEIDRDDESWKLLLEFKNTKTNKQSSIIADLVIACDGIRSSVRNFKYSPYFDRPLKYLGILLVLGITQTTHPLGNKRVFQTVDGSTRIFAMPFASHQENSNQNIMWQLSFPYDETAAKYLSEPQRRQDLRDTSFDRCCDWHEPIPSLIESTDLDLIMGIPAYDRDPRSPDGDWTSYSEHIALIGDAAHPMSPFKGQGANQALLDAVSLADFLGKSESLADALSGFQTEMVARVTNKVRLSRERVITFHQPDILESAAFSCRSENAPLYEALKEKGINSTSGDEIENLIIETMASLNKDAAAEVVEDIS